MQSGRAGLRLVVLLVAVGLLGYLGWTFASRGSAGPQTQTSDAAAASAHTKAQKFADAQARAQQTGQPVSVIETFSDTELSSLANQAAQAKGLPFDQIGLHATSGGTVQGQAEAHVAGQNVPVSLVGTPIVTDGNRVALNVTSTKVGAIPLPGPVADQVTQSIREPLEIGEPLAGFQNVQVRATEGQVTVSGVAHPM